MTFHGLSSPNELKTAWFNMTEGQNIPSVDIVWEFDETALNKILNSTSSQASLYVVNCLYKVNKDMIGHYIALFKPPTQSDSEDIQQLIYFDPLATLPQKWFVDCCLASGVKIVVDLEGSQAINGNSCGFRCLFKLLKYCLGYMPTTFAELYNGRVDWYVPKDKNKNEVMSKEKKKTINTTINKTKREIQTISSMN